MLHYHRVTPSIKFAGTHLYTWVERGTVRVKCLAHEHNAMSPARSRTRTTRSGVEQSNHPKCLETTRLLFRVPNSPQQLYYWSPSVALKVRWSPKIFLTPLFARLSPQQRFEHSVYKSTVRNKCGRKVENLVRALTFPSRSSPPDKKPFGLCGGKSSRAISYFRFVR